MAYTGDQNKIVSSSYLYRILQKLKTTHIDTKVDKQTGYSLSKNDLTDELKASYDNASAEAHTHTNATVLNGITAEKITQWDSAPTLVYETTDLDLSTLE